MQTSCRRALPTASSSTANAGVGYRRLTGSEGRRQKATATVSDAELGQRRRRAERPGQLPPTSGAAAGKW